MKHRTGHVFKRGNSGTFYLRYVINGKVMQQALYDEKGVAITTADGAERARVKIMAPYTVADEAGALENVKAKLEGRRHEMEEIEEQRNPPLMLRQAWSAFSKSQNRPDTGKATLAVYELTWGRFCKWMTDTHPTVKFMRDVTQEIAGEFAAWLISERRSPNTFNKYMNVLALVFNTVKDKARLTVNPWSNPKKGGAGQGITRKKLVTYGRRELTIEELRKVCEAAKDDLRLLLAVGLYSGMRLGDCATLRWSEVDLVRGRIVRIPNKTGRSNPKPVTVPLHPTLAAMLAEIPAKQRTGNVMPRIAMDYARHESYVTDRVQALFKQCKIQTTRTIEGRSQSQVEVGFHSLRHSFVSMCAANGVPLSVVQALVGHTSPAMTRHYTHRGEAAALAAVTGLPSITGKPVKALPPVPAPHMVAAEAVLAIADRLDSTNWNAIQSELRALAEGQTGTARLA